MKIIDLSVVINEKTPAYPGDPHIKIETLAKFVDDTYNDHKVCFGIHSSGTHIDAPNHMVDGGKTLDQLSPEQFIGHGCLIEVKNKKFDIGLVKSAGIEAGDIVLFNTGMGELYHDPAYYAETRPAMSEEIARYLVEKKIKMAGFDMCSPDLPPFPVHHILLSAEVLIIENMGNLSALAGKDFTVYALPLKLQLDGAPARVIARIND
jgi:kynurenine formamidase